MFFSALMLSALFPLLWLHQRGRPEPVAIKQDVFTHARKQIGGRPCPDSF